MSYSTFPMVSERATQGTFLATFRSMYERGKLYLYQFLIYSKYYDIDGQNVNQGFRGSQKNIAEINESGRVRQKRLA